MKKLIEIGDLVIYNYGDMKYMGYCFNMEDGFAKIQNVAISNKEEIKWKMLPQESMDPISYESARREVNKEIATNGWVASFNIWLGKQSQEELSDLGFINLSQVYNKSGRQIASDDWSLESWTNISKEIH